MTYTDEELKASLRLAIGALELTPDYGINHSSVKDDDKASAVLRAYFDKFDEERALLEAVGIWLLAHEDLCWEDLGPEAAGRRVKLQIDTMVQMQGLHHALMAKEGYDDGKRPKRKGGL